MQRVLTGLLGLLMVAGVVAGILPNRSSAANLDYLDIDFGEPAAILPLDRYLKHVFTVKNTDSASHVVNFTIYITDTKQEVVGWPQPQTLYLDAGETESVTTFLDERWGELDKSILGEFTRTLEWRFTEQGSKTARTETVTYKITVLDPDEITGDLKVSGKVSEADGDIAADTLVTLSTGPSGYAVMTRTQSDGVFSFAGVPSRTDWMLSAGGKDPGGSGGPAAGSAQCAPPPAPCNPPGQTTEDRGQRTDDTSEGMAYALVDPTKTSYTLQLVPPQLEGSYKVTKIVTGDMGYWKGAVAADESAFLVIDGMENWSDTSLKEQSKVRLFDFTGKELWSYAMGWEGWGADLSRDGAYAAFTTSNHTKTLGVLNGKTGEPIWVKKGSELGLKNVQFPGEGGGIDSKEIVISSTNKYVAIGGGGGDLVVADLLTGDVVWQVNIKGQVRKITFDAKDEFVYAGSGDGNAYKLKVADGSEVWQAWIGGWPFTNSFVLSTDEAYLATGAKTGEVTVVETSTGRVLWTDDQRGAATWLDISSDGTYVVAGGGGQGATTLYDLVSGKQLWRIPLHSHQGRFAADGQSILIGDQNLMIADLAGNTVATIEAETGGTGQNQVGGGQFAYITRDGSTVVYTHRDISPGSIALVIATGSLTATEAASAVTATTDDASATDENSAAAGSRSVLPWVFLGLVVVLVLGGVIAWATLKRHHARPLHS